MAGIRSGMLLGLIVWGGLMYYAMQDASFVKLLGDMEQPTTTFSQNVGKSVCGRTASSMLGYPVMPDVGYVKMLAGRADPSRSLLQPRGVVLMSLVAGVLAFSLTLISYLIPPVEYPLYGVRVGTNVLTWVAVAFGLLVFSLVAYDMPKADCEKILAPAMLSIDELTAADLQSVDAYTTVMEWMRSHHAKNDSPATVWLAYAQQIFGEPLEPILFYPLIVVRVMLNAVNYYYRSSLLGLAMAFGLALSFVGADLFSIVAIPAEILLLILPKRRAPRRSPLRDSFLHISVLVGYLLGAYISVRFVLPDHNFNLLHVLLVAKVVQTLVVLIAGTLYRPPKRPSRSALKMKRD